MVAEEKKKYRETEDEQNLERKQQRLIAWIDLALRIRESDILRQQ